MGVAVGCCMASVSMLSAAGHACILCSGMACKTQMQTQPLFQLGVTRSWDTTKQAVLFGLSDAGANAEDVCAASMTDTMLLITDMGMSMQIAMASKSLMWRPAYREQMRLLSRGARCLHARCRTAMTGTCNWPR